ncbi:MAG: XdhC family protein [Pseudomonadota bacterium]
MTLKALADTFETLRAAGESCVLATVTHTEGSTYTKAGAHMLIGPDDVCHGLLSGGCLEGDLAQRGASVRDDGLARAVTYDMRNRDHDEIWGLGLGCDGAMDVLLTRIGPDTGYAPFGRIAQAVRERRRCAWALVTTSDAGDVAVGASMTLSDGQSHPVGLGPAVADELAAHLARSLSGGQPHTVAVAGGAVTALVCPVPLPPRLLVAGAGPDVMPVLRFAAELGWSVTVVDHRPAYVDALPAPDGGDAVLVRPAALGDAMSLDAFDAALIMSHHLASDRDYLRVLASADIPYVGLLGPSARRQRLLDDLGSASADALGNRLFAPVGLDLGARGPAGIALSAVAQIQAVLSGRKAAHFADATLNPQGA